MKAFGIDIGGSGVKGCIVDCKKGEFDVERLRIPTPEPATPEAVIEVVGRLFEAFSWKGPVGIGFPGIVRAQTIYSAANLDDAWIGMNLANKISKKYDLPATVLNDADAAAEGELAYGAGLDAKGVVIFLTVGTGIGSALFKGGIMVPNTEFGHLNLKISKNQYLKGERYASDAARKRDDLDWPTWTKRFNKYLEYLCFLFSPDRIILGGGLAKKEAKFMPFLKCDTKVKIATLQNKAGIIGAAAVAARELGQ